MTIGNGGPLDQIGKFGERFRGWLDEFFNLPAVRNFFKVVPGGSLALILFQRITLAGNWLIDHPVGLSKWFGVMWGAITTGQLPTSATTAPTLDQLMNDPSLFLQTALGLVFGDPKLRDALQNIGAAIYDSSVAAITGGGAPFESEGARNARGMIGFVTALGGASQLAGLTAEAESAGQMKTVGQAIQNVYWNLGLGFLTWQTMAPILQGAILEPLQRDVQRVYRGQRFSLSQQQDLYALGQITRDEMAAQLVELGWRDTDVDHVIALAYTKLSRSDVIDLWHAGIFDDAAAAARMRALGYSPDDIQLLLQLEVRQDVTADKNESVSVLTQAMSEGLISQDDFIRELSAQGYTLNEIDLRLQLIRIKQQTAQRQLSVGQLKQAWQNNIILDEEARHHLTELGYADTEVQTILDTWKAEIAPKFLQVNQSNVLEAYRFGILDRRTALDQLTHIGYSADAATTLIEITEAKYPEAFGGSPPRKQKYLTLGAVTDLYAMGRLNDSDVLAWARQVGYSDADSQSVLELIKAKGAGGGRALSQATIESAYATGVFSRDQAQGALEQLGFSPTDADTELTVYEQKNPATFNPQAVTSVRQPTIAVLVKAYQAGFIDQTQFYDQAKAIGYSQEAAQLYLETSNTKTVKGTKALTKAEITEAFKKNLFDYSTALSALEDLGYSTDDADLLLRLEGKGVTSTDIWTALLQGWIDPQSAIVALLGLGFTEDEINAAIAALPGGE